VLPVQSPDHIGRDCTQVAGETNVKGRPSYVKPPHIANVTACLGSMGDQTLPKTPASETAVKVAFVGMPEFGAGATDGDRDQNPYPTDVADRPGSLAGAKPHDPKVKLNGTGAICAIRLAALTKFRLHIEGAARESYCCLSDSGAQIAVLKKSAIAGMSAATQGQIKIQGVFGEPIEATLVTLMVRPVVAGDGEELRPCLPVTFAVSDALVQDYDAIVPTEIANELHAYAGGCATVSAACGSEGALEPAADGVIIQEDAEDWVELTDAGDDEEGDEPQNIDAVPISIMGTDAAATQALIAEQRGDETLAPYWDLAAANKQGMLVREGVLYHKDLVDGYEVEQLCVPLSKRAEVMQLGHEALTAGHLSGLSTRARIRLTFWFPGMRKQIIDFCASCIACQQRARARVMDRVPITPMVRPEFPFVMCHADCIGPLDPASSEGHKYALCIVDDCTRWPTVFLLKSLSAKATVQSFLQLFMTTGMYQYIVTDRGSNFCSQLEREFLARLSVTPRFLSPAHPQAAGLVERWNGSFKRMLHFAMQKHGRQWHKAVPFLVWAMREIPNRTTGRSPFTMQYGRVPRGPLITLKETWTGQREMPPGTSKSVEQYMRELNEHLASQSEFAVEHATVEQEHYAKYYNAHAAEKSFQPG